MRALGPGLPPVFVLTDPERLSANAIAGLDLPRGWGVIYRHFGDADRVKDARALREVCNRRGLCLLIANDPALALRVGADGVHWPEAARMRARRWAGRFALMTMSWHRARPVLSVPRGIDAALVSTVFKSRSPTAGQAIGAVRARRLALQSQMPVYGLGGVAGGTAEQIASRMGLASVEGATVFAAGASKIDR